MTWNMGGKNQSIFQRPQMILPNVFQHDVVAICAQECPRKLKTRRAAEIEAHMTENGFVRISTEFLEMWEMFLLCFVKSHLF